MKFTHLPNPLAGQPELDCKEIDTLRFYRTPDGQWLPSVTTVTGWSKRAYFDEWRKKPENELESIRATDRGTVIHSMVERYLRNEQEDFPEEKPAYRMLFKWMRPRLDLISNIQALETALYSNTIRLAGRCDCIAQYEGVPSVIDFKGSSKSKREDWIENYFLQTTAYYLMWYERTKIKLNQIVIIIGTEEGACQVFKKDPKQYIPRLKQEIVSFWKDMETGIDDMIRRQKEKETV